MLDKLALVRKIKPLLERQGYIIRPSDSKFVPRSVSIAWDAPWVYVQSDPCARCDLYHRVFYNVLDHIHTYCRSCWKVVVRPQTVTQLFDLYEFQREMGIPCKCGIELRSTVFGGYGGYFYCRSKEQGLERYEEVRKLVDERLSNSVPVILKRYCTEFELGGEGGIKGKGPSNQIGETTPEEKEMESYIESYFPRMGTSISQPKYLIADVMLRWIHHAWEIGDKTCLEFTDNVPLTKPYITYHEKEIENGVTS